MHYLTQQRNAEFARSRMLLYPHKVATKRNGNIPWPEGYENIIGGHFCRIPLGDDYLLWMFEDASIADAFRKKWGAILMEIVDERI
jgi:hypothetical protein